MATVNWGSNSAQVKYATSQQEKLKLFENSLSKNTVIPEKNMDDDGVLNCDTQVNTIFNPLSFIIDQYADFCNTQTAASSEVIVNVPTPPYTTNFKTLTNPQTQEEKLNFSENKIQSDYIAPITNKHIFGVMPQDGDLSFYYSPNYSYGMDNITEYQQVIVDGDGDKECHCLLVWEDITVTT